MKTTNTFLLLTVGWAVGCGNPGDQTVGTDNSALSDTAIESSDVVAQFGDEGSGASPTSQGFGPSTFWFEPAYGQYPHFHTGIDMVAPFGTVVHAADDGVVALVGSSSTGYGNYVVIAHSGGLDTLYGHLSTAVVKVGDLVTQGQPVGLEGSTGNSTGAHLHFELRINQRPVDPAPYLPPGAPSAFKG